jgi:hypothetical protein
MSRRPLTYVIIVGVGVAVRVTAADVTVEEDRRNITVVIRVFVVAIVVAIMGFVDVLSIIVGKINAAAVMAAAVTLLAKQHIK